MFARRPATFRDHRQKWWFAERPKEVEAEVCALIRRREARDGRMDGCVVLPELLVSEVGCQLLYFRDEERASYGLPPDVIGALKPAERLILVYYPIEVAGRESHTIGEEIGHMVLHAKGEPAPGQMALGLEEAPGAAGRHGLFCRSEGDKWVDGGREPAWMSTEAGFFAACLQMPRDRYGPVAEKHLRVAVRDLRPRGQVADWDERLNAARVHVAEIREHGWDAWQCSRCLPGVFDTDIVAQALNSLAAEHQRQVSRAAQRRRLTELGFAIDAAEVLRGPRGEELLPYFEFFILSERLFEDG